MRWIALPLVATLVAVACGPTEEERAAAAVAAEEARQDSLLASAEASYDPAAFDTVTWESEEARLARGQQVYTFSCAKCHGPEGLGDAGFVMGGDTLRPPSFREPTWALAGDEAAIRRAIYVGTTEGMPHWGVEGIKPEMVDAVTAYIMEGLGSS